MKYSISSRWLAVARALAAGTEARLILGVNLEANQSSIAVAEARALLSGIGSRSMLALEIGNEPNWYATLPWYRNSGGRLVFGRPRTYDLRTFSAEVSALGKRLPITLVRRLTSPSDRRADLCCASGGGAGDVLVWRGWIARVQSSASVHRKRTGSSVRLCS